MGLHPEHTGDVLYEGKKLNIKDVAAQIKNGFALVPEDRQSQGLIQSVGTVNLSERFDADTRPHVHFICTTCGAVIDLPQTAAPLSLGRAAEECTGCQVHSCQLTFTGLCRGCQSQTKEEAV